MNDHKRLHGKVAIITGAANGIGLATAKLFLQHGARVFAVDLPGQALNDKLEAGDQLSSLEKDITDADAPEAIIGGTVEAFGGLDIVMNNAGICLPGSIEEIDDETWERTMAVNVTAMFRLTREAIPELRKQAWGRIINVGSIMSDMAGPDLCAYGASKHAVAGLTKAMAVDLGKYQITANYLQPGAIITALSEPFMDDPDFMAYWENKAPMGRLGNAEEVAEAALFLASNEAQFISGVGFNVDGGAIVNF